MTGARPEEREFLAGVDSGCIAQNVYLFCACVGLADREDHAGAERRTGGCRMTPVRTVPVGRESIASCAARHATAL
jgi:hypothetical protein